MAAGESSSARVGRLLRVPLRARSRRVLVADVEPSRQAEALASAKAEMNAAVL